MPPDLYFDSSSATPILDSARQAIVSTLDAFGDPLSIHAPGREARRLLDQARATVAGSIGAQPDEIVFTSGGTESVALALFGAARAARELGARIVISAVEHPAVGGVCHMLESDGFEVVTVPVDGDGRMDLDVFSSEIRRPRTLLASVQHANHELGTMQQVAEASRLAHEAGAKLHSDACQTVGRLPIDVDALGVDLLSLSAHKFGGPPGVGALYVRRGVGIAAFPCGDDRERKRRSGMENLPGITGMAAALTESVAAISDRAARQWSLTAGLREAIGRRVPGATVHGHSTQRAPHLVCFSVEDVNPETLMMTLDDRGFRIGGGSFCSGQPSDPSPVLAEIGLPNRCSFRIGLVNGATNEDLDRLLEALSEIVAELREVEHDSEKALARFRSPKD